MMIKIFLYCLAISRITNGLTEKCKDHEFDCDNPLKCIPFHYYCNGIVDCEDKTDESSCEISEEESMGLAKIIISTVVILLVSVLIAALVFLYRKVNFRKSTISAFDNPIYQQLTVAVNSHNDELNNSLK